MFTGQEVHGAGQSVKTAYLWYHEYRCPQRMAGTDALLRTWSLEHAKGPVQAAGREVVSIQAVDGPGSWQKGG